MFNDLSKVQSHQLFVLFLALYIMRLIFYRSLNNRTFTTSFLFLSQLYGLFSPSFSSMHHMFSILIFLIKAYPIIIYTYAMYERELLNLSEHNDKEMYDILKQKLRVVNVQICIWYEVLNCRMGQILRTVREYKTLFCNPKLHINFRDIKFPQQLLMLQ